MLQQENPEDFVIATGEQYSVREFIEFTAKELGMEVNWRGTGVHEKGYDEQGRCIISVDPAYFRPAEVEALLEQCLNFGGTEISGVYGDYASPLLVVSLLVDTCPPPVNLHT